MKLNIKKKKTIVQTARKGSVVSLLSTAKTIKKPYLHQFLHKKISYLGKKYHDFSYDGPIRLCKCGLAVPRWTSWMNTNLGMRFWTCPVVRNEPDGEQIKGCKYYE